MRLFGLAGWSNSGKTTLITRLLPLLAADGLRVSTVKHAHSGFDMDRPGKDSWRHREAGAIEVMVASERRFALIGDYRGAPEPPLEALLARMAPVDLVLIEGFRRGAHPRLEVHRAALGQPLLYPDDPGILGIAAEPAVSAPIPSFALDDVPAIAAFVRRVCGL